MSGWLLSGLIMACSYAIPARADGDFKILRGTESPSGDYALAYGVSDLTGKSLDQLKSADDEDAVFDANLSKRLEVEQTPTPKDLKNYLVRLRDGRVVSVVPQFQYFPRQNHFNLEIGWSQDNKQGLAIYDFRYGNMAIAWIEPESQRVTDVRPQIETAFRRVLAEREGKIYTRHAREYSITLLDPIISGRGEFILGVAHAFNPRKDVEMKEFDYRLKFRVERHSSHLRFVLISAHRGADWEYDQPLEDAKTQLKAVYEELRSRLHGRARVALQRDQALWKQRAGDDDGEISLRVRELKMRLRDL